MVLLIGAMFDFQMTLLPIADRELRVAARGKAARRLRIFFALGAVAIAGSLGLFSLASNGAIAPQLGVMIFGALKWSAFIFACSAGVFLTSDCLSEEKREGTLGLLFLTDLRGYDVVFGKLFATSLRCFYSLLAIFPVMAFSFVLGGVSGDEFSHTVVSVCNTLWFSLALGMVVSVVSRDTHKAMTAAAVLTLFFLFLAPELDYFLLGRNLNRPLLRLMSPAFNIANTAGYHARDFWMSALAVHLLGWMFLVIASFLVPLTWREKGARQNSSQTKALDLLRPWLALPPERKWLDNSPVTWLILRDRWAPNLARLSVALALGILVLSLFSYRRPPVPAAAPTAKFASSTTVSSAGASRSGSVSYTFGRASVGVIGSPLFQCVKSCARTLSFALEVWLVMHIVRFYIEGRRNGFFELLLVTPTTMPEVVRGHWLALRKLFLPPLAAQLLLALAVGTISILANLSAPAPVAAGAPASWWTSKSFDAVEQTLALTLSNAAWIAGLFALGWMAIRMGLTSNRTTIAILKTLCYTIILPWVGVWFAFILSFVLILSGGGFLTSAAVPILMALPQLMPPVLMIAVSLLLIRAARRRVLESLSASDYTSLTTPQKTSRRFVK